MSFLPFLAVIMRGHRTVIEQSENGQSILWPFSHTGPLGYRCNVAGKELDHNGRKFENIKNVRISRTKLATDSIVLVKTSYKIPLFARVCTIYKDASTILFFKDKSLKLYFMMIIIRLIMFDTLINMICLIWIQYVVSKYFTAFRNRMKSIL